MSFLKQLILLVVKFLSSAEKLNDTWVVSAEYSCPTIQWPYLFGTHLDVLKGTFCSVLIL